MLHVFYGPDRYRAIEEIRRLRESLDKEGNNTVRIDRDQSRRISAGELRAACQTASFFAEDRIVIIEGLQARFSGQRRRGSSARARKTEAAPSELEEFAEILTGLPATTTVIMFDDSAATAFIDSVSGRADVKEFRILVRDDLRRWLSDRTRADNISISPQAFDLLLQTVDGNHIGELIQELEKLSLYANGRRIEVEDIEAVGSGAVDFQGWDLTDAIIAGRADRALSVLQRMDRSRYPSQMLFVMITRQYRQILLGQAMLREGMGQQQIGTSLGLAPYPLKKVVEQAGRYPVDKLEVAYRRLLETDVAIKTGVTDVDTALDMIIVELTELARQPARRGVSAR